MGLTITIVVGFLLLVLFTYKASKIYFKKGLARGIGQCNSRMNFLRKMAFEVSAEANEDQRYPMADVGEVVEMVSSYLVSHDWESCDYHLRRFFSESVIYFQRREG